MTDSDTDRLDVVVSGGSMGGLFTGLALRNDGHTPEIFEQSTGELRSRGAGIVAQPRMLDFLERHGIATPEAITTTTSRRQYLDSTGDVERTHAESMTFTSWDAVYRHLRSAFPDERYHPGRSTVGVERTEERATFRFDDGSTVSGDLAVVAEGGQSSTRDELLNTEPEYAGYVAWRGVLPEASVPSHVREQFEDTFTFYDGSGDLILAYLIPGPDGETEAGSRRLNWVWYDNVRNTADRRRLLTDEQGTRHAFSVPPGTLQADVESELLAAATDRLPDVFGDLVTATDDPFVQTIYDLSVTRMVSGRVCLLGDAAFVARPHTAAGTAKAAGDGIALSDALEGGADLTAALQDWETDRLDVGRRLVAEGRRMGESYMD